MEIHKLSKSPAITPPRWQLLTVTVIICMLLVGHWVNTVVNPKSLMSLISVIIEAILVIGSMMASCIHYIFTEDGLAVCFLWIPLRRIRWRRITHALYAHAWADPKTRLERITNPGAVTGQIIYVTIDGCPRWHPILTMRWVHSMLHPFRAFTIWLPYSRKNYFIDAFKKHYPDLEMQPLDEWKRF